MASVLLSYDVHDSIDHKKLKELLLSEGWRDTVISNEDKICHLANTTFLKDNTEAMKERDWFYNIVGLDNIIRLMVFNNVDVWYGIVGAKHSTDSV
jgi:hypothetical protein